MAGSRLGAYEITGPIGAGGMGEVYRARDPQLGRELALKILPEHSGTPEQLRRFEQEARSASRLNHPAVVTIYDVGRTGDQRFIAMELVEGQTLRTVLAAGLLPQDEAIRIAKCVAEGLAAAHEKGIVHRDLKPENLMITPDGGVKILDFGLARLVQPDVSPDEETAEMLGPDTTPGTILGTVAYMSPEQAAGRAAGFAADQFSLGVILYEMLSGRRPFQRENTIETLHAIIREEPPPVTEINRKVPGPVSALVARLLAKRPSDRYGSTRDLVHDLEAIQSGKPITTRPVVRPRARRGLVRPALAVLAGLALIAVASVFFLSRAAERRAAAIPDVKSLAVLPFTDLSGDPAGSLYSRGVSETISARLASVSDLQVMPPSAAAQSGAGGDLAKLARELGATMILNGSVQRSGDRIRVTYSLINAATNVQLAAATIPGSASDLFALQDALADDVVRALELQTAPSRNRDREGFVTAADQDRYVEALGFLQRYESEESVDRGIALLEGLTKSVRGSAIVHAALGRGYLYKFKLTRDPRWMEKATAAGQQAVRLDPERADIHITLGEVYVTNGKFDDAIGEFQAALRQQPNSGEATLGLAQAYHYAGRAADTERAYLKAIALMPGSWAAHNRLGFVYLTSGRVKESLPRFEKVVELTPDNTRGWNNLGAAYLQLGELAKAKEMFDRSTSITPNSDALGNLGYLAYFEGRYAEAAQAYEKAVALSPNDHLLWLSMGDSYRLTEGGEKRSLAAYERAIRLAREALEVNPEDALAHATRALASARSGKIADARTSIESMLSAAPNDPSNLYYAAVVENLAGNPQGAVELLSRAISRGLPFEQVRDDPDFRNLKGRDDFKALESV